MAILRKEKFMLTLRERAFRNVIFAVALVLFLLFGVSLTYVIGRLLFSVIGAFLLAMAIFILITTIDTWRKVKEE
jgi:uncharacterized membrane protein YedE/YeeE